MSTKTPRRAHRIRLLVSLHSQKPPREGSSGEPCRPAGSPSAEARWDFARRDVGVGTRDRGAGMRDRGARVPALEAPAAGPLHSGSHSGPVTGPTPPSGYGEDEFLPREPPASRLSLLGRPSTPAGLPPSISLSRSKRNRVLGPPALTQTRLKCPRACLVSQGTSS